MNMDGNITYYLYHIPGKKIGVTRNLNSRVTEQQGYSPDEYEVLDQSTDIGIKMGLSANGGNHGGKFMQIALMY